LKQEPLRRVIAIVAAISLVCAQAIGAPRNSWNKIRYRGGTVQVKLDPWDWNTTITVNPDEIVLLFNPHTVVRIKPSQVRSLSFGEQAHRRVEDIIALGLLFPPLALFGVLHASKDQLVGIVYDTESGKMGAVLLETPLYRPILDALKNATGKPIEYKQGSQH
jgi:hypothetical protein